MMMNRLSPTELPNVPQTTCYTGCVYSSVHDAIFLIGSKGSRKCYKYNISKQSYEELSSFPNEISNAPVTHTVLSLDSENKEIISVGGSTNHYAIYNTNNNTWDVSLNNKLMKAVEDGNDDNTIATTTKLTCNCSIGVSAVKVGNFIHIVNGCSGNTSDKQYSYQIIDLKSESFLDTSKLPKLPHRVYLKGLIYIESKQSLLLFGGMEPGVCTSFDTMYMRKLNFDDLYKNEWQLMNTKLPKPLSAFGYCTINIKDNNNNNSSKLYSWLLIIGGGLMIKSESKEYYNSIYCYDIINDKFYLLNETIETSNNENKFAGIGCVYDSKNGNLHIIGGAKGKIETNSHIMFNIGMNMNGNNKNSVINNNNAIKYRESIWKTLMLVSAGYIVNEKLMIPTPIWHLIFDMIDDGLLLPLLVEKPYKIKT